MRTSVGGREEAPTEPSRIVLRASLIRVTLVSLFVLIPCFWQSALGAGDLRSHVYNAWLVQLIERGQAPGLWVVSQWNNVLFDQALSAFGRILSLQHAGQLAAGLAILLFFWGSFAFVGAITGRSAWTITPILLAISYGWTFQEGLMNYYLSLGLAFVGLALVSQGLSWRWGVLAFLFPVAYLAHPLGGAWLLAGAFYLALAKAIPARYRALVVCGAFVLLWILRIELQSRYLVGYSSRSAILNLILYNGFDQLLFSRRYALPILVLVALFVAAIVGEIIESKSVLDALGKVALPLEIYLIVEAAILFLPNSIYLPRYTASISALTTRATTISAILLCAIFASLRPKRWHVPVLSGAAAIFFLFLYQDVAVVASFEEQGARLVRTIPAGQRVIATIAAPPYFRFSLKHMSDAACIGHCFSYGNYEAATGQFRVRASQGNPIVVSDIHDATLIEEGRYVVQPADIPIHQLYQCNSRWTELCIRNLGVGEIDDLHGVVSLPNIGQSQEPSPVKRPQ